MKVLDKGHIYECHQLDGGKQTITFMKRTSDAVHYTKEWGGLQSQELLRVLIDRTKFVDKILPCKETKTALYHLRMALFWYEVRAYRRKKLKVNKTSSKHPVDKREYSKGTYPKDIPFTEKGIEFRKVGKDGHIRI